MKRFPLALAMAAVVFLGLTSSVSAQRQGPPFGRGYGSANLLRNEAIQKELKMTDEQKEKLRKGLEAVRGNPADFRNLSAEERQKRFEEMDKKGTELVKDVLDEKQQKRLEQIELQMAGPGALMLPDVAEKLKLDDAQKAKMKEIIEQNTPATRFNFRNATQEERQKYITEMRKRAEKEKYRPACRADARTKRSLRKNAGRKVRLAAAQPQPRESIGSRSEMQGAALKSAAR